MQLDMVASPQNLLTATSHTTNILQENIYHQDSRGTVVFLFLHKYQYRLDSPALKKKSVFEQAICPEKASKSKMT